MLEQHSEQIQALFIFHVFRLNGWENYTSPNFNQLDEVTTMYSFYIEKQSGPPIEYKNAIVGKEQGVFFEAGNYLDNEHDRIVSLITLLSVSETWADFTIAFDKFIAMQQATRERVEDFMNGESGDPVSWGDFQKAMAAMIKSPPKG